MAKRKFRYDVAKVIECVRDRPCIWDKRLDSYKDRLSRRAAWEEIFVIVEPTYETMSAEAKQLVGEQILNKWTNMRDTFVKTLRKNVSGTSSTPYTYHKHMLFLKDVVDSKEFDYANITFQYENEEEGAIQELVAQESGENTDDENYTPTPVMRRTKKRKKIKEEKSECYEDNIDFVGVNATMSTTDRLMNEDEAFFASLLPTVVKYTEDERLEFRIEVLKLMKKIKQQSSHRCEVSELKSASKIFCVRVNTSLLLGASFD